MSDPNADQQLKPTPVIDWNKVRDKLPKTMWPQLECVQQSYKAGKGDPAREVELGLREKLSALRVRFEALQEENKK